MRWMRLFIDISISEKNYTFKSNRPKTLLQFVFYTLNLFQNATKKSSTKNCII